MREQNPTRVVDYYNAANGARRMRPVRRFIALRGDPSVLRAAE